MRSIVLCYLLKDILSLVSWFRSTVKRKIFLFFLKSHIKIAEQEKEKSEGV